MKNKKIKKGLRLLVFAGCLMVSLDKAHAYDPPIGIPDPGAEVYGWGNTHPIDSAAPDTAVKCPNWPAAVSNNCYYIDNTHPQATDTNNTYGYPDKPRMTIPSGTFPAGSYFELTGGPYATEKILTMQGTQENPVWFRGASTETAPSIQAMISAKNSTYAIFENLDFNGFTEVAFSLSGSTLAHNVCMRNSKFRNMSWPGHASVTVANSPIQDGEMYNIIYYNNLFSDIGDWQAVEDDDYHGIGGGFWGETPPTTLHHVWVLNNTGYHISGNLVQFNGDQRDAHRGDSETPIRLITNTTMQTLHHLYVGKNVHHHNRQTLASQKFSTDTIVSQNVSYANYSTASGGASAQVYQEGANYVWFLFNDYRDSDFGIRQSNTNFDTPNQDLLYGEGWAEKTADLHVYAVGNKISHMYNTIANNYISSRQRDDPFQNAVGILSQRGYYTRNFVDNTIFNVGGGFYFANTESSTYLSGNVIAGVQGIDAEGQPMYHGGFFQEGNDMAIDYSFLEPRDDDSTIRFFWFAPDGVRTTTLASFQSTTGECEHCYEGDPKFVDPANYDLHPRADSPLIGKGIRHEVYDTFEQRYGFSIAYDFDGNPRPTSGPWTLGAFEYQARFRADVNNSGDITSSDALLTLRNSLGLDMNGTSWQVSSTTGDVNCDNVSNSADALLILRYSLGLGMEETSWCES